MFRHQEASSGEPVVGESSGGVVRRSSIDVDSSEGDTLDLSLTSSLEMSHQQQQQPQPATARPLPSILVSSECLSRSPLPLPFSTYLEVPGCSFRQI